MRESGLLVRKRFVALRLNLTTNSPLANNASTDSAQRSAHDPGPIMPEGRRYRTVGSRAALPSGTFWLAINEQPRAYGKSDHVAHVTLPIIASQTTVNFSKTMRK